MNRIILSEKPSEWMVIYTKSKYEKKVDQLLKMQNLESFCPTIRTKRKWADRLKEVELPLFNSYIFVRVKEKEHLQVLQTAGVLNFVYFCGKPAVVPSSDIDRIRLLVKEHTDIESVSMRSLHIGDKVIFRDGILFDRQGEIVEIQGKSVLVVIKQLDCALIATVKADFHQIHLADKQYNKSMAIY